VDFDGGDLPATQPGAKTSKLGEEAMAMRIHLGAVLAAGVWAASLALPCDAQNKPADPAPCTVAPQPEPCGTTPAKPSATEKFPFPGTGGASNAPAPNAPSPSLSGVPDAPETPSKPAPAAGKKDFPFPGDDSKPDANGSSSSGSSSSNSGDDPLPGDPGANPDTKTDGSPALKDKGSDGTQTQPGRHILHRVNPVGTKLQTADEREAEDLDIAHFYTQTGDLQGAYLRSQDAVKTMPDDPAAHFALAEAAMKLNKKDEAIAEYAACLKLDPDERQARNSRKALARLKP